MTGTGTAAARTTPGPAALHVTAVRLTPVLVADPPLLNTQGVHQPYTPRLIVEVDTAGGHTGLGETYGDTKYLELARPLADQLPGRQVTDLNGLAELAATVAVDEGRVSESVDVGGLRGVQTAGKLRLSVVSAFEVAFLDALGQATGLPVHALLGGKLRDQVDYSAYLFYRWADHPDGAGEDDDWAAATTPQGIVAQAQRLVREYGFGSAKLKGGVLPPDEEVAAVRALADAFPGMPLRLDPNGAWSVPTSLKVAGELRDVLEYLEDPTSGTRNMAEVAAHAQGLPLATNMCVTTFGEIQEAFTTGAVQVVLSDHHYWGGLRTTRELATVCRTFGVGVSMHSNTHLGISLAAMTQVAATVPGLQHACDTHYPWQTEDVLTERVTLTGGAVPVSNTPGLGVTLDRDRLEVLHRRWLADDGRMRERDDAAAMRQADPAWTTPTVPRW